MGDFQGPEWVEQYCVKRTVLTDCIEKWEFTYQNQHGDIYICKPYPGIHLWVNDIYMPKIPTERLKKYRFIKLNYCCEGRAEVLLKDERYVYLEKDLLSIDTNEPKEEFLFPGDRYAGLEMVLNMQELEENPIRTLTDCGIDLTKMEKELWQVQGSYLAQAKREWRELAEAVMERLKRGKGSVEDFRFDTLHLLYLLQKNGTVSLEKKPYLTKGQRRIVAKAEEKITSDLKCRYTVEMLADEYGISPSSLKKYFEQVYGMPISEYLRKRRMELACCLLKNTRMSVANVAAEAGYSNQGKFGTVFKKYTQKTPLEYRRLHRERREDE